MRRDYFTCVFLACIAGALAFVCFEPLYFKYEITVPREFGLFESIASCCYLVFFLVALPIYAGYKKKYWIAVGLACYGALIYLPKLFYPSQFLLTGEDASLFHMLIAMILRGIYGMMNAPFAALSGIWGDDVASHFAYLILPCSILFPFFIRLYRFYRDAYVAEQLDPASVVAAPSSSKFDRKIHRPHREEKKPEVLGTVISAPVRKEPQASQPQVEAPPEKPQVEAPPVKPKMDAPEKSPALEGKDEQVIPLPGPKPAEEVIQLGAPRPTHESQAKPQIRQPRIDPSGFKSEE
ncbi:MAG: hypothetical protein K6A80_03035 [Saccharofermentans sp.]|nr:hypothetical protein [Saccharofermentans sp.]